jgi:hypothetical protein
MATAPAEGQQERMEQALVDLKVLTADQAHSFVADANTAALRVQSVNASERADVVTAEMSKLMNPVGAQFSACDIMGSAPYAVAVFGGFITAMALLDNQVVGSPRANAGEALAAVSFIAGLTAWLAGC